MYLQQVEAITKIHGQTTLLMEMFTSKERIEQCTYNLEASNPDMLLTLAWPEQEAEQLLERGLVYLAWITS